MLKNMEKSQRARELFNKGLKEKDLNKQIAYFKHVIKLCPKFAPYSYYNIGLAYMKLWGIYHEENRGYQKIKLIDKAIKNYKKAKIADVNFRLGQAHFYKQYTEYGASLPAISLDGKKAKPPLCKKKVVIKYDKALKYFKKAIKQNPKNADAYFYLGEIYHWIFNLDKAIKYLKKAIKLKPAHKEARKRLDEIYLVKSDLEEDYRPLAKNHKTPEKPKKKLDT